MWRELKKTIVRQKKQKTQKKLVTMMRKRKAEKRPEVLWKPHVAVEYSIPSSQQRTAKTQNEL
jgi:hypothetical protein